MDSKHFLQKATMISLFLIFSPYLFVVSFLFFIISYNFIFIFNDLFKQSKVLL